jgi:hypothetical protein
MDLLQWLNINGNCARLAELIAVNGGTMEVSQFGHTRAAPDANRYGRLGLTVEEAFTLQYMRGAFDAMSQGRPGPYMQRVKQMIDSEIRGSRIELPAPGQSEAILRMPLRKL